MKQKKLTLCGLIASRGNLSRKFSLFFRTVAIEPCTKRFLRVLERLDIGRSSVALFLLFCMAKSLKSFKFKNLHFVLGLAFFKDVSKYEDFQIGFQFGISNCLEKDKYIPKRIVTILILEIAKTF